MLASLATGSSRPAAQGPADLALYDGNVVTVAEGEPRGAGACVGRHRIAAIALDVAIKPWIGLRTETIDLRRMTVMPGFNDSHAHFPFGYFPCGEKEKK